MERIVVSVNAGSSSVKVSVYKAELGKDPIQIAECQVNGLSAPPTTLNYSRDGKVVQKDHQVSSESVSHADAFNTILEALIDDNQLPRIKSRDDISIICHRIVHGGDYTKPQLVSNETYCHLENLNDLAPLHNANSLGIVQVCVQNLPGAKNIACFDSQFHSTLPPHVRTYPINQDVARKNHLRKYGFHGISYAFITRSVAKFLGKSVHETGLIALHLGSGASACAIKNGKSWDTSMGLTPLAGLPGATRTGSVDPSLVFHYASNVGRLSPTSTKDLHISRAEEILNKESGWKALTGTTDFSVISNSIDSDSDPRMRLAFDLFVDRVCAFIGSYYVSLGGQVDALVFAGGIGEKSDGLRTAVVEKVRCLGFEIDEVANRRQLDGEVKDIGAEKAARHRVLICATDEQFEMARACTEDKELW